MARCYILASMSNILQHHHENMAIAYDMMMNLKVMFGEQNRASKGYRVKEVLYVVHIDLCGPMSTSARGGYKYFITFIDDYSRYGYIYLMCHKSEAFDKFKEYKAKVENHRGKSIKSL